MASSKEYLDFILDQLSGLDEISCRAMMGEYIVYYRGRIVGGIYDDRFLVKPTKSAVAMMPDADKELPYEGAKEMLLVDNALDHTRANPNSWDETLADFEWYDESTNPQFSDVDNPNVPNLEHFEQAGEGFKNFLKLS